MILLDRGLNCSSFILDVLDLEVAETGPGALAPADTNFEDFCL
jgi:hypothetical protein